MDRPCRFCGVLVAKLTKGLCHTHYQKLWLTGNLDYKTYPTKCRRCKSEVVARGLCGTHYKKWMRTGTFKKTSHPRPGWTKGDHHRLNRYGITREQHLENLEACGNTCEICRHPFGESKNIHQDHDHETRRVRGLLCSGCNIVVGYLERLKTNGVRYDEYLYWHTVYAEDDELMPSRCA